MASIYLSARYGRKAEMQEVRRQLTEAGHTVVSRWLDAPDDEEAASKPKYVWAQEDLEDLKAVDAFVLFTDPEYSRGGKHVEFGYALANWLDCYVIGGHQETIFHYLPYVMEMTGVDQLLEYLI